MSAREEAGAAEAWEIRRGRPDAEETAAVLAVLTALLLHRGHPPAPAGPPRTTPAGWARRPPGTLRRAGSWRPH